MEHKKFQSRLMVDELAEWLTEEIKPFLQQRDAKFEWPPLKKAKDVSKGDFAMVFGAVCGKNKLNVKDFTEGVATELNTWLAARSHKESHLIKRVETSGGYLNFFLNRPPVFELVIKSVLGLGNLYGTSEGKKGQRVVIEHTSANPNGPLHIGNLRNVIIGGILAKIMKCVGYDVKQHFYVNDLGFQIGLTAIGFMKVYDRIEPQLKIDQWIGMIYAVMNTFSELQQLGLKLAAVRDALARQKGEDSERVKAAIADIKPKDEEKTEEYLFIWLDLERRQPHLFTTLLAEAVEIVSIKKDAGELNLAYERNEPHAVKIFRHMVLSDLSGMQETLDTYGMSHDSFDFESELGWEGSNDRVLEVMKASPFFVPPTQSNSKGVPEGGYLDLDKFIKHMGLPQGKKGYQPDYPPLYVLRPDGSTLYTYRDVVYSLKKAGNADIVLNVIASEQNVAQEKVSLALELVQPGQKRKQYHLTYELVKLLGEGNVEKKMSSRRGRYVLADELYSELKKTIREIMQTKFAEKGKEEDPEFFEQVMDAVSTSAMKYALISVSTRSTLIFNIQKVCNFDDSSAPFLLYNATRFFSLFRKYDSGVAAGSYPPLETDLSKIDWSLLGEQFEWELLFDYVLELPTLVQHIACPPIPEAPGLPEFPIHLLCDFLVFLVRAFSKYWAATKILKEKPTKEEAAVMFARLHLLKTIQLVLNNGLNMLTMTPLQRM